jgi:hypothetical protein
MPGEARQEVQELSRPLAARQALAEYNLKRAQAAYARQQAAGGGGGAAAEVEPERPRVDGAAADLEGRPSGTSAWRCLDRKSRHWALRTYEARRSTRQPVAILGPRDSGDTYVEQGSARPSGAVRGHLVQRRSAEQTHGREPGRQTPAHAADLPGISMPLSVAGIVGCIQHALVDGTRHGLD